MLSRLEVLTISDNTPGELHMMFFGMTPDAFDGLGPMKLVRMYYVTLPDPCVDKIIEWMGGPLETLEIVSAMSIDHDMFTKLYKSISTSRLKTLKLNVDDGDQLFEHLRLPDSLERLEIRADHTNNRKARKFAKRVVSHKGLVELYLLFSLGRVKDWFMDRVVETNIKRFGMWLSEKSIPRFLKKAMISPELENVSFWAPYCSLTMKLNGLHSKEKICSQLCRYRRHSAFGRLNIDLVRVLVTFLFGNL